MSDKLISQYDEIIPSSGMLALIDPGDGFYKKAQVGNLPGGGGGGGAITLSTPTLTASIISSSQINLSWTNVANETSYELQWSPNGSTSWTTIGGTIAANTTSYNHTGLTASTLYYYRIRAIGDGTTYLTSGYGASSGTTSSAGTTPLITPGSFSGSVISSSQINLSWADVANETSYELQWSPNGSTSWTTIGGTIAAGTTSYNHTGLTASTLYYYRLRAIGSGLYSNSVYATTSNTTSSAGYDTDAQTFFTNAGITDTTQKNAQNDEIVGLKADGLYTKVRAYLPFVGGDVTKHSFEIISAANKVTWTGSFLHTAGGVEADVVAPPSTSTGSAIVNFNMNVLTANNFGIHFYRTDNADYANNWLMGWSDDANDNYAILQARNGNTHRGAAGSLSDIVSVAGTDSRGFFSLVRTSANVLKLYRNGSQIGTTMTSTNAKGVINQLLGIFCRNTTSGVTQLCPSKSAGIIITDGLTDAEVANLYARIQTKNTALSRAV